jgi:hypothetical protein
MVRQFTLAWTQKLIVVSQIRSMNDTQDRLKRLRRLREKINQSTKTSSTIRVSQEIESHQPIIPARKSTAAPPPKPIAHIPKPTEPDRFQLYLFTRTFIIESSRRQVRSVFQAWNKKAMDRITRRKPVIPKVIDPPVTTSAVVTSHRPSTGIPSRKSASKQVSKKSTEPDPSILPYAFKSRENPNRKVDQEMLSAAYRRVGRGSDDSDELSQTEPAQRPLTPSPIHSDSDKQSSPAIEPLVIEKDFIVSHPVTVKISSPPKNEVTPRRSPAGGNRVVSSAIRELRDFTGDDPFELKNQTDRSTGNRIVHVSDNDPPVQKSPVTRFVTPTAPRRIQTSLEDVVEEPEIVDDTDVMRDVSVVSAHASPRNKAEPDDDEPIDDYFLQEPNQTAAEVDERLEASKQLLAKIDSALWDMKSETSEEEDAASNSGGYKDLLDLSLSDD